MHRSKLYYRWDSTSSLYDNSVTKKRPDFIITSIDGIEVACAEVKPPETPEDMIDIDRCRIQEHCKRQLHVRIYHAKTRKELITYGFMIAGRIIELYITKLDGERIVSEKVKTLTLPTMPDTHTAMKDTLEIMIGFFDNIVSSLPSENDTVEGGIYESVKHLLAPTLIIV